MSDFSSSLTSLKTSKPSLTKPSQTSESNTTSTYTNSFESPENNLRKTRETCKSSPMKLEQLQTEPNDLQNECNNKKSRLTNLPKVTSTTSHQDTCSSDYPNSLNDIIHSLSLKDQAPLTGAQQWQLANRRLHHLFTHHHGKTNEPGLLRNHTSFHTLNDSKESSTGTSLPNNQSPFNEIRSSQTINHDPHTLNTYAICVTSKDTLDGIVRHTHAPSVNERTLDTRRTTVISVQNLILTVIVISELAWLAYLM